MINKGKALIKRVRSSKDGSALASNFGYLSLLQIASYIFPLITIPYLAKVIGIEGIGKIAFAGAVILWFKTISDWGFNYTATRDVARNRDNLEEISRTFSNVLWARICLMLFSLFLLCLLVFFVPLFRDNKNILLVSFLLIPGHIFFPDWFFQAIEKMKFITILNLVSKALFSCSVFIFIKTEDDYILQPLLVSFGYIVSGICAMYLITCKWGVKIHAPKIDMIIITLKGSSDVFINNISRNLYNSFSLILLGYFSGSTANGILDAGRRFVGFSESMMKILDRVFFPFLSRKIGFHAQYAQGSLVVSIIAAIVLCLASPMIIDFFYTDEFAPAIPILQLMSISLIATTLNSIYGTNYLVLVGKEKVMRNITLVVSIIGFITAFPLVYYFSYFGAAINIVSAQTLLGLTMMIAAKRKI